MTVRKVRQITLDLQPEHALHAAEETLTRIGAKITTHLPNGVRAHRGVSFQSWGEDIEIIVKAHQSNRTLMTIASESSVKTTSIDYGKNSANIENFVRILKEKFPRLTEFQPEPGEITPEPAKHPGDAPVTNGIFISYRRSDSADITGRIYDRLVGRFGRDSIFKDVDSIPLGFDFKDYLDEQVSACRALLAIIGDEWLEAVDENGRKRLDDPADFVRIEIESALKRGIPVIPLLVYGAGLPQERQLPDSLKKLVYRNGLPIRPDPDFHNDMDRLIAALEKYTQQA